MKTSYLHWAAWDLAVTPLLDAVERLSELDGIAQARLDGDRVHAIVAPGTWTPESLTHKLAEFGILTQSIETAESTLEDVFTLLAHTGGVLE